MASLGNIGYSMKRSFNPTSDSSAWRTGTNGATLPLATASVAILLTFNGLPVESRYADVSGNGHFYDLKDGTYYAFQTEPGQGNVWKIVVLANVPTVTKIFSNQRGFCAAFV